MADSVLAPRNISFDPAVVTPAAAMAAADTEDEAKAIKLYSRAALFAMVIAFTISVVGASGADGVSGRLGGDFPAFYAAGSIAARSSGVLVELPDPSSTTARPGPTTPAISAACRVRRSVSLRVG